MLSFRYLAAGWARELYQRGISDFDTYSLGEASVLNNGASISIDNKVLGKPELGESAAWLTDAEILQLVSTFNPDALDTAPAWLSAPTSLNYWEEHLLRTIDDSSEHNKLHISIVNTERVHTLAHLAAGSHWFVVAWLVIAEAD